jgi:hypothetical protein
MTSKIAVTALAFALVLGSASAVMANSHHHAKAHEVTSMDPREAFYLHNTGGLARCGINGSCNGWNEWLQGVHANAKYYITGVDYWGKAH